jgi:hypothetical protein
MLARPQQASSSTRTRQPAASSSSIAAIGMAGSVHVVNESARNTTSPRVNGPSGGWWAASQRTRWARWKRGSGRAAASPSVRSANALAGRQRPGRLDSGASAEPSVFSRRTAANSRARAGTP